MEGASLRLVPFEYIFLKLFAKLYKNSYDTVKGQERSKTGIGRLIEEDYINKEYINNGKPCGSY